MKKILSSNVFFVIMLVTLPTAAYFVNLEVQSYLGRSALEATGLEKLSLDTAVRKAGGEDKLVLVEVSAIWCSTCRKLDNEVFADERVKQAIRDDFVFSRLEYETEEAQRFLAERNASGVPNLWVLDGDGKTLTRLRLTFDPIKFTEQLKLVAAQSP